MSDLLQKTITISDLAEIIDSQYTDAVYSHVDKYDLYRILHDLLSLAIAKSELSTEPRCVGKVASKKEKAIADYLISMGYTPYHNVIKRDCCGDKRPLPFDFGIIVSGKEVLIEYDGEQHSHPIKIYGGHTAFDQIRRHDRIKTEYCKKHNIPLLRINYDSNIKEQLFDFISKHEAIGLEGCVNE